jgi:hypothetical protein
MCSMGTKANKQTLECNAQKGWSLLVSKIRARMFGCGVVEVFLSEECFVHDNQDDTKRRKVIVKFAIR